MSTLIVDAGSTKMEWALTEKGKVIQYFDTQGFNPNYAEESQFAEILAGLELQQKPQQVRYYGSGCGSAQNCQLIKGLLQSRFPDTEIHVTHDLMAACHAVLGHERGIACILGTGSNSCLFDGENIVEQAISLGYLVGDEGSGCYIGRKLVRAYFYDLMPLELKLEFENIYQLNINNFIDRVYHQPEASKYLASFTEFAGEHQSHPFIQQLVKSCFKDFIDAFVLRYKDCRNQRVCFVGSVAFYFQYLLHDCLSAEGLTMGKVMRSPMEGLIQLYS